MTHCAIYLGTADLVDSFTGEVLEPNAIFLAHCGTDRGWRSPLTANWKIRAEIDGRSFPSESTEDIA